LQQIERLRRLRLIELGRQRVKIVPERHDLARRGRRQQLDVVERQPPSIGPGYAEHVAVMDGDAIGCQRTETGLAVAAEAKPRGHATATACASAGRMLPV